MNRRLKFYRGETGTASMGLLFHSESGVFCRVVLRNRLGMTFFCLSCQHPFHDSVLAQGMQADIPFEHLCEPVDTANEI